MPWMLFIGISEGQDMPGVLMRGCDGEVQPLLFPGRCCTRAWRWFRVGLGSGGAVITPGCLTLDAGCPQAGPSPAPTSLVAQERHSPSLCLELSATPHLTGSF